LLPLADGEDLSEVVGAPALDVGVTVLDEQGRSRRFLDVTCRVPDLEIVFAKVVDQIVERVADGQSSTEAVRSTIEEFRALLAARPRNDASREKVAGLIGELLLLNDLLDQSPEGWMAWRGPESARHDFTLGGVSFEVKVSMGKGRGRVTINGLEQLSEPAAGALYLQHYELEADANGRYSIASLGRAILRRASEPARVEALIAELGCPSVDDEAWNAMSFRLEGDHVYRVDEDFPRLIASDFATGSCPQGVSSITYCVDLGTAAANLLSLTDARQAKARLVP
jgi:hypothetical protein